MRGLAVLWVAMLAGCTAPVPDAGDDALSSDANVTPAAQGMDEVDADSSVGADPCVTMRRENSDPPVCDWPHERPLQEALDLALEQISHSAEPQLTWVQAHEAGPYYVHPGEGWAPGEAVGNGRAAEWSFGFMLPPPYPGFVGDWRSVAEVTVGAAVKESYYDLSAPTSLHPLDSSPVTLLEAGQWWPAPSSPDESWRSYIWWNDGTQDLLGGYGTGLPDVTVDRNGTEARPTLGEWVSLDEAWARAEDWVDARFELYAATASWSGAVRQGNLWLQPGHGAGIGLAPVWELKFFDPETRDVAELTLRPGDVRLHTPRWVPDTMTPIPRSVLDSTDLGAWSGYITLMADADGPFWTYDVTETDEITAMCVDALTGEPEGYCFG